MRSSGIGGQAVIEGVMMKNKEQYAVAVRKPNNEIAVDKQEYHSVSDKYKFLKLPILRGIVAFVESLSVGMRTLTFSASFYEEEEAEKPDKLEKAASALFKESAESVVMGLTVILAMLLAIGIFMILPWFITEKLAAMVKDPWMQALIEGGLRLGIFIVYVFCISLAKDIRRVYMYHGAEHKTINCVENGLELTVENVRKQSKEHRRCGTSFMLYVMIISIIFFMFIRVDNSALRILFRILLVPAIAGVSYEFIRFTGKYDNLFTKIVSRPGMWMQALTTREPEDDMIEVAICSVEAVFDWKAYIAEVGKEEKKKDSKKRKRELAPKVEIEKESEKDEPSKEDSSPKIVPAAVAKVAPLKRADATTRRGAFFRDVSKPVKDEPDAESAMEEIIQEKEEAKPQKSKNHEIHNKVAVVKKADRVRRPMPPIEELHRDSILEDAEKEDDDDEILSALDKFFE